MDAIVFDLELMKRFKKGQLSEIVEIGACKVNLTSKEITDQFQVYIKPKSGYFSKSTKKFIKMTKEDEKSAVPFKQGIQQFSDWAGEDYYLCSWGRDDKAHLINQCIRTKLKLDWIINYNDIQPQIGNLINPEIQHSLGLKNALKLVGIDPVGKAHRGIDDAINTAELLLRYHSEVDLKTNKLTAKEISEHYKKLKQFRLQYPKSKVDGKK
ncbi:3'-5' exonuclease [Bacillus sp. FJAT-45350]|uniref:3'-5' exonuclease n=1 Tax=Bacillus sp. FJAT-45350 TaxID=2011014 RepID=UPI000BB968A9|nr:3'-5' exonuclease [Bacillus sp. FJAT-45350]